MDDDVGGGQVQARAARPQRDEEDAHLAPVEPLHQFGADRLRGRTLQGEVADALGVQPLRQQVEHGSELAEQQDAVAALDGGAHQLHTGVQLGASALPVVGDEVRVAADLPQPHQHGKDGHLVFWFCGPQLLAGVHHRRQIQLALLGLQLDAVDVLRLRGQFLQHVGLHPAEDEGAGQLVQPPHRSLVILLHNGLLEPGAECLVRWQIPRHQEGKDAPQLPQPVFHRGAGQRKAHPAVHPADGLIFLGRVVLDGLCLVEDTGVEFLAFVEGLVAAEQVIARHHKVGGLPLFRQRRAVGRIAVHHHAVQFRRELFALLGPVQHQRRRADDEAGQGVLPQLLDGQQVAQHLHRLAKAHIVGQNAAHAVAIQRSQPAIAVPLVFSQYFL